MKGISWILDLFVFFAFLLCVIPRAVRVFMVELALRNRMNLFCSQIFGKFSEIFGKKSFF